MPPYYDLFSHWLVDYDIGITEFISSGSPLFDENHLIVGDLTGGNDSPTPCATGVPRSSYYAKFSTSWDKYNNLPSTHLKPWLDPINSGVKILNGCGESYEPNNSLAEASDIWPQLGNSQDLFVTNSVISTPSDVDFFDINLNSTGTLQIDLGNLPEDYTIELFNSSGTQLLGSSDLQGVLTETIVYPYSINTSTTLKLKIFSNVGASNPCKEYKIWISWSPGTGCPITYEPNDPVSEAWDDLFPQALGSTADFETLDTYISTPQDEDYYEIPVQAQGQLSIDLNNLPADYDLYLLDENEVPIPGFTPQSGTTAENITYPYSGTNATTFYAKVVAAGSTIDACSPYTLTITWTPNGGCVDTYEDNDLPINAKTVTFSNLNVIGFSTPKFINSAIFDGTDIDLYQLNASEDGTADIQLSNLPANYDLAILDANGNPTTYASQLLGTATESIILPISGAPINYMIEVKGVNNASSQCNQYKLEVTWTPTNPCVVPAIPTPYSPGPPVGPGIVINTESPTFDWEIISGITEYELNISEYPYGTSHLVFSQCVNSPPYTLPPGILTSGKLYRWDVQSSVGCSACKSNPSYELYFQVQIMPSNYCGAATLTAPSGTLEDGSGSLLYANNSDCSWLIQPPNVSSIYLDFDYFDLELGEDSIIIHDGTDATAPIIGKFTGFGPPPVIQATSGAMFLRFISNGSIQEGGWQANYSSRLARITEYEYWFDDAATVHSVSVTGALQSELSLDLNIPTPTLAPGLHIFNIRFLDDLGQWSSPLSQYFHKGPVSDGGISEIIAYEYWIDEDFANKVSISHAPTGTLNIDTLVDIANISPGLHIFNIRVLDEFGQWSSPLSQYFHKRQVSDGGISEIVAYEYWVDEDYANKVSVSHAPVGVLDLDTLLDMANLDRGLHTFNLRVLDEYGQWSSVLSQYFHKIGKPGLPLPNLVVGYRYWFDDMDSALVYQSLAVPENPLDLMVDIDASSLDTGFHRIHLQFLDTMEYWSSVLTDTFYRGAILSPNADFSLASALHCVGSSISFQNLSTNATTYSWNFGDGNGSTSPQPTHTYQTIGSYTVTLIAEDSTTGQRDTLVQNQFVQIIDAPQLVALAADTICIGGSSSLTTSGATTYSWSPANSLNTTTGNTVIASPGTTTTYTVNGSNQCGTDSKSVTITVDDPQLSFQTTAPACGMSTGSLTANVSGAIGNLGYAWSNNATTQTVNNLPAGTYSLTVTDQLGCSTTESISLSDLPGPFLTGTEQNPSCGDSNGSVSVNSSTGTLPIHYLWNTGATDSSLANLPAGTYTVIATDANACKDSLSFVLNDIAGPSISSTVLDANCGQADGSAQANTNGGTSPFQFEWSTGAQGQSISGLPAGSYQVWVIDANACTDTTSLTVADLPGPDLTTTGSDAHCGQADGAATAIPVGGNGPFLYQWSTGTSGNTVSGLAAGSYQVWVSDGNNCTDTTSFMINDLPGPSIVSTAIDANCGNADGSAIATASGGTSPYLFEWNTGATGATLNGIAAGSYQVWVTDANNCTDTSQVLINNIGGPQLLLTASSTSCHNSQDGFVNANISGGTAPYQYSWSSGDSTLSVANLPSGLYTFQVLDVNGCLSSDTVTVNAPAPILLTLSLDQAIQCYGDQTASISAQLSGGTSNIHLLWNTGDMNDTLHMLGAGNYSLLATDANACQDSASISISQPDSLHLSATQTDVSCFGTADASIQLMTLGGTGMYTYQWNTGDNSSTLSQLDTGLYWVHVFDENDCPVMDSFLITEPSPLALDVGPDQAACDSLLLGPLLVDPTYQYQWSSGQQMDSIWVFTSGSYILTATDTSQCHTSDSILVSIDQSPQAIFTSSIDSNTVEFQALDTIHVSSYTWTFGDGSMSNLPTPSHTYTDTGTYLVQLIVSNGLCEPDTFMQEIHISPTVGLAGFDGQPDIRIYPNPADQMITVSVAGFEGPALQLLLFDMLGKEIKHTQMYVEGGKGVANLAVKNLSNGVYIVRLIHQNQHYVKKLEIIH
ncbi:MAG: PKD domain-containing protein [Bacteroidota bacterium]